MKFPVVIAALLALLSPSFALAAAVVTPISQIQTGSLIRGTTFAAVYYLGRDGFRYVFPNDKTYFTWYADFSSVKFVSDSDLAKIQIGGNVTYRPGTRMVKINSDPKVYAVDEDGSLRWMMSEDIAIGTYGAAWNTKIDDVPDAFFGNYRAGANVESPADFVPASVSASTPDINDDKRLKSATVLNISDDSFDNASVTIKAGSPVRWFNNGANKHTATATDLSWGTGTITPGGNFARYFDEPGTYAFFCSYHPEVKAVVIVE